VPASEQASRRVVDPVPHAGDDIEAASLVRPALTTIAQDPIAMGAAAVEVLLTLVDTPWVAEDRLDSDQAMTAKAVQAAQAAGSFTPRTVPTHLVRRESCTAKPRRGGERPGEPAAAPDQSVDAPI